MTKQGLSDTSYVSVQKVRAEYTPCLNNLILFKSTKYFQFQLEFFERFTLQSNCSIILLSVGCI